MQVNYQMGFLLQVFLLELPLEVEYLVVCFREEGVEVFFRGNKPLCQAGGAGMDFIGILVDVGFDLDCFVFGCAGGEEVVNCVLVDHVNTRSQERSFRHVVSEVFMLICHDCGGLSIVKCLRVHLAYERGDGLHDPIHGPRQDAFVDGASEGVGLAAVACTYKEHSPTCASEHVLNHRLQLRLIKMVLSLDF